MRSTTDTKEEEKEEEEEKEGKGILLLVLLVNQVGVNPKTQRREGKGILLASESNQKISFISTAAHFQLSS